MAVRGPRADQLRCGVAWRKIATVRERICDYAKNYASRVPAIEDHGRIEPLSLLPAMARMAGEMVHDVLDAFAARDAAKAIHVSESDRQVDDFYNAIFRVLVTFMMENPQSIGQVAHQIGRAHV